MTNLVPTLFLAFVAGYLSSSVLAQSLPLVIESQGSFCAGGTVIPSTEKYNPYHPVPAGQTLHGDHASVFYQIPPNPKKNALVFLHGAGQSARTWQTTPDGREGMQNIMLRKGYPVYLVDQPRRGEAGRSTVDGKISASPDEQFWWGQFRIGLWPERYEGSQFAVSPEAQEQFFRQMTPNTGPYNAKVIADAVASVFDRTGKGVLVTHSQGCGPGWLAAMKTDKVKAIVAYEPGSGFVFPEGEVPDPIANNSFFSPLKAESVPMDEFLKLTKIPICIYYGDYVSKTVTKNPHLDYWRAALLMAEKWADTVNRYGGNAKVVLLPEQGLKGNSHFPFSDINNREVIELFSNWLDKELEPK